MTFTASFWLTLGLAIRKCQFERSHSIASIAVYKNDDRKRSAFCASAAESNRVCFALFAGLPISAIRYLGPHHSDIRPSKLVASHSRHRH